MAYQDGDSRNYGGVAYVRQDGLWYPQPDPALAGAQGADDGAPYDASQGNASDMSADAYGKVSADQLTDQIALTKDAFVNATDPAGKVNALWQLGSLIMAASQQGAANGGAGNSGGANGYPPQAAQPPQGRQSAPQGPDDGGDAAPPRRPLPPPLLGQSQGAGDDGQQPSGIPLLSPGQQNPLPFAAGLAGAAGGMAGALQQLGVPFQPAQGQQNAPQAPAGGIHPPQQLLPPSFWDQPQGPGASSGQQPSGAPLLPPDQQNPPPFVADLPGAPGGSDGSQQPSALSLLSSDQQMPPPFVAGLAGAPGGLGSALQQLGASGGMTGSPGQLVGPQPALDQRNPPPFVAELAGAPDGTGAAPQQSGSLFNSGPSGGTNAARSHSLFKPGSQPRVLQPIPPIDSSLPGMPMQGIVPPFAVPRPARRPASNSIYDGISEILRLGEGDFESYNTGTKGVPHGKVGFSFNHQPAGTVTGKTINQILRSAHDFSGTDRRRMFAVGRYQMIPTTLAMAKEKLGLTGDELFTPELQDRIFREVLIPKAGGGALARFLSEGIGTVDQAQYAAAKEWASVAVPKGLRTSKKSGYRISDGTMSYYGGAANGASMRETHSLRKFLFQIQQQRNN